MVRALFAAISLGLAAAMPVQAQDAQNQAPAYRFDEIVPGSYVVVSGSNGLVLEHVFHRGRWGKYVVSVNELRDGRRFKFADFTFDRDGRLTQAKTPDRGALKFQPHGCTNVMGSCSYAVVYPDGSVETRNQEMAAKNGGYMITTRDTEGGLVSSTFRKDGPHGWPVVSTHNFGGKSVTFELRETHFRE